MNPSEYRITSIITEKRVITYRFKGVRYFMVRDAAKDDDGNFLSYLPNVRRKPTEDLQKIYNEYPSLRDLPILDNENNLKTWDANQNPKQH